MLRSGLRLKPTRNRRDAQKNPAKRRFGRNYSNRKLVKRITQRRRIMAGNIELSEKAKAAHTRYLINKMIGENFKDRGQYSQPDELALFDRCKAMTKAERIVEFDKAQNHFLELNKVFFS